jgi:hypothetical protein
VQTLFETNFESVASEYKADVLPTPLRIVFKIIILII